MEYPFQIPVTNRRQRFDKYSVKSYQSRELASLRPRCWDQYWSPLTSDCERIVSGEDKHWILTHTQSK